MRPVSRAAVSTRRTRAAVHTLRRRVPPSPPIDQDSNGENGDEELRRRTSGGFHWLEATSLKVSPPTCRPSAGRGKKSAPLGGGGNGNSRGTSCLPTSATPEPRTRRGDTLQRRRKRQHTTLYRQTTLGRPSPPRIEPHSIVVRRSNPLTYCVFFLLPYTSSSYRPVLP